MSLRADRCRFTELLAELVLWVKKEKAGAGWALAFDEVTVHSPRAARRGVERLSVEDAVHKRDSFHHKGLAADLNLYIFGVYISDGAHAAWRELADKWKSMDPNATAGIDWNDANHLSFGEGK